MGVYNSYYETLYSRPVVALNGFCAKHKLPGTISAYLGFGGATGSGMYAPHPRVGRDRGDQRRG